MENNLEIFENPEFGSIRIIQEDGRFLFCGTDVARALGYAKPRNALNSHCKGALKRGSLTAGGMQELTFIPEGDVYRLITQSKLPSAEKFEVWVFDEVLPCIRKNGGYMTKPLLDQVIENPSLIIEFARRLVEEQQQNQRLREELETARPKAEYYDAFIDPEDCTNFRATAKELKVPERKFISFLIGKNYVYRAPSGNLMPYAGPASDGLFIVKDYICSNGHKGQQTLITPKGKSLFLCLAAEIH